MVENHLQQELFALLRRHGAWPISQTDATRCGSCGAMFHPPKGRPDILCLNPTGRAFVIEVKSGRTRFDKALIKPEQRRWLQAYCDAGGAAFIAAGTRNVRPRAMYVVPWLEWVAIEEKYGNRESVPAKAPELQPYALEWVRGLGWEIPAHHPLAKLLVASGS